MKKELSNRLHTLDTIRGIALISMILFHTAWDLSYIYNVRILQSMGIYSYIWQQSICITFIFLSGFCFNLGKKHLKRGALVFLSGVLVSAVTFIFMRENLVLFGVLTLIGSAMLIFSILEKFLIKLNPLIFFILNILLFLFAKDVNEGYLGFYGIKILNLPDFLYRNHFTSFLGFPSLDFVSTDYFSIFPWLFLFGAGFFLSLCFKKKNIPIKKGINIPIINFIGRNSLLIYLIHQPIIYGLLYLIFLK